MMKAKKKRLNDLHFNYKFWWVFRIKITWLKFLIKTRESFDKALHYPHSCSNSFKGFQCCASGFYLCTIPRNSTQFHSMPRNSAKFRATESNWKPYSSRRSNQSKVWSDKTWLYEKQISNSKAKSITLKTQIRYWRIRYWRIWYWGIRNWRIRYWRIRYWRIRNWRIR